MKDFFGTLYANSEIQEFTNKFCGFKLDAYPSNYFERRLHRFKIRNKITKTHELIDLILNNPSLASSFKDEFHISYTKLFREPTFFIPLLHFIKQKIETEGTIRIWHAGCAQGHEVFSLAILLEENNLLEKCKIYATDVNTIALRSASKGIVDIVELKCGGKDYLLAGGQEHLVNHFYLNENTAILKDCIHSKIKFAQHELGKNPPFQKFDLVICRNVLIYYKESYQMTLIKSLLDSIHPTGYLGLSNCESPGQYEHHLGLKKVDLSHNIYQI